MYGATSGEQWLHPESPNEAAVLVVVTRCRPCGASEGGPDMAPPGGDRATARSGCYPSVEAAPDIATPPLSDPSDQSYKSLRISGRHGHGQNLRCHHANSGSAIGS